MENDEIKLQVGVKVILKNKESILLLKRSAKYGSIQDSWDIPGGRIDSHETLLEGLARELREEIKLKNLDLANIKLLTAQDIIIPEKGLHTVRLSFEIELANKPEISIDEESKEYKWFTREEIVSCETLDRFLKETLQKSGYL
jgi:ADP-ribose pyrophosphatase YjhB (NUDIX family)